MLDAKSVAHEAGLQAVVGFVQQAGHEREHVAVPDQVIEIPDGFATAVDTNDFDAAFWQAIGNQPLLELFEETRSETTWLASSGPLTLMKVLQSVQER